MKIPEKGKVGKGSPVKRLNAGKPLPAPSALNSKKATPKGSAPVERKPPSAKVRFFQRTFLILLEFAVALCIFALTYSVLLKYFLFEFTHYLNIYVPFRYDKRSDSNFKKVYA